MSAKLLSPWRPEDAEALAAWQAHVVEAHPELDIRRAPNAITSKQRLSRPSDVASVRAALAVATACRCGTASAERSEGWPKVLGAGDRPRLRALLRCLVMDSHSLPCWTEGEIRELGGELQTLLDGEPAGGLSQGEAWDFAIKVGNEVEALHEKRNPLRAQRLAAGLSQAEAGAAMGISRGAYANAEIAGAVTPAMLERARVAMPARRGR